MPDVPEPEASLPEGTLYALAMASMKELIAVYLRLSEQSEGLARIRPEHLASELSRSVLLGGLASRLDPAQSSADDVVQEWRTSRAVPFDTEAAITRGVYRDLRSRAGVLVDQLASSTGGFAEVSSDYIHANPHMLPVFQRLAGISSKSELKRRVGAASDNRIPAVASKRLADEIATTQASFEMTRQHVLQGMEPTLEGIVRDLVGRVLLENIVADALERKSVPFMRESEYDRLSGVIYDFRADFVIPNATDPLVFVEVRKSSSRHASLYAKDKMFSALNWKGKHPGLMAVLVVEGPWTVETLRVMTNVFDYVMPLSSSAEVAETIAAYLNGDLSRLKWLISLSITPAHGRTTLDSR